MPKITASLLAALVAVATLAVFFVVLHGSFKSVG